MSSELGVGLLRPDRLLLATSAEARGVTMSSVRASAQAAAEAIRAIPVTEETVSLRAKALQAIEELEELSPQEAATAAYMASDQGRHFPERVREFLGLEPTQTEMTHIDIEWVAASWRFEIDRPRGIGSACESCDEGFPRCEEDYVYANRVRVDLAESATLEATTHELHVCDSCVDAWESARLIVEARRS